MRKAVIFDLDGVVVTTDEYHYKAWERVAKEEGIYFDRTINENLRGVSRMESLEIILKAAAKTYSNEEKAILAQRKNGYYQEYLTGLSALDILPGVITIFKSLKELGVKVAIGSSSKNALLILEKIGLINCFDAIVDGNIIKNSKPDPEVFLLAAEMLGVSPEECAVVEDANAGIEAALAAGMKAVGVGSASKNPKAECGAEGLEDISPEGLLS